LLFDKKPTYVGGDLAIFFDHEWRFGMIGNSAFKFVGPLGPVISLAEKSDCRGAILYRRNVRFIEGILQLHLLDSLFTRE